MKSKIHEYQKTSKKSMSKNFTIYLALILCLFASKMIAQVSSQNGEQAKQTFEERAKSIALKIEKITKEEKEALKLEIESVNNQLENNSITKEQAEEKKNKLANARAAIIEDKVAVVQEELKNLVQEKVDGKIEEEYKPNSFGFVFSKSSGKNKEKYQKRLDSLYNTSENRTTSQFVFATGFNNLVTNGAVSNSDFGYLRSVFFEWGITLKTRLLQNSNLLHLKYGLGFQYNMLHATDNRVFVDNGSETVLVTYPIDVKDNHTYFKNVYFVLPIHLEFDFSKIKEKDGKKIFKSQQGFRFGIGGFAGVNTNSKQFIRYEYEGKKVTERTKADFNVNDFTYGVSTYVGYKHTSLYLKYDLNTMFSNNSIKQNNISLGVRFDYN